MRLAGAAAQRVEARAHGPDGCARVRAQGNWEEAEQLLQDAYEKDAKNADTLANLVVAGLHLGKGTSRYAKCGRCLSRRTSLHHASPCPWQRAVTAQ